MMHEFRLPSTVAAIIAISDSSTLMFTDGETIDICNPIQLEQDGWAVCRIFQKRKLRQKHRETKDGTSHLEGVEPQESLHHQLRSPNMSVENGDQDSNSAGDDPEVIENMTVSEGTSPASDNIHELFSTDMTPFGFNEPERLSNSRVPAYTHTVSASFALPPEKHLYEANHEAGLQLEGQNFELQTSDLRKSQPVWPAIDQVVRMEDSTSFSTATSTASNTLLFGYHGMIAHSNISESTNHGFPHDHTNNQILTNSPSYSTGSSPSAWNPFELGQSRIFPSRAHCNNQHHVNETDHENYTFSELVQSRLRPSRVRYHDSNQLQNDMRLDEIIPGRQVLNRTTTAAQDLCDSYRSFYNSVSDLLVADSGECSNIQLSDGPIGDRSEIN